MSVLKVYRGDIFFVHKHEQSTGSEMESGRPAVVVSNDIGNEYAPIVEVVYLTKQEKKPMPTHVELNCNGLSIALCEQITTVSKERLGDFVKCCTADEMRKIDEAVVVSLGLTRQPEDEVVDFGKEEAATMTDRTAEIERDLYKRLYEQLLEKVVQ